MDLSFLGVTSSLWGGFQTTLLLFALTLMFSLPLGLAVAFGSMSRFAPLRYLTKTFIWIIRGTPLMLQVLIIFYVPGLMWRMQLPRFDAALIAFVINYTCYFSEIFRGGIESISRSQYEAGQVLGMHKSQIFFRVVLLQVIKRITAPMSNEVITLVKDTALARIIMVVEVIRVAEDFMANMVIWPLFYTGVFFLAFIGLLTLMFAYIEKRLDYFRA